MKVYEAYEAAIRAGMSRDPRPEAEVRRVLDDASAEYARAEGWRRECFDAERLWNPYADCRFSCLEDVARETEAERMLWGIDIGTGEVLLADRLRQRGERVDAIVAHHPTGMSRNMYPQVVSMQADMYHGEGVPINVAEGIVGPRTGEVLRGVMGSNYDQASDAARILGIPMFNVHSAADNMVQHYLTRLFEDRAPRTLGDIVETLMGEPEFQLAARRNCVPTVMVGSKDSRCGRVMCKMTGGTSGPKEMYESLARAGVGTVVGMHFPESHYEAAREAHVNLVVSGHMPSDSLGVNLICDIWEREGIEVVPCSGLIRCSRNRHVREEVLHHPRRVRAGLRLHTQGPGPQGGPVLPPGDAVQAARPGRAPVHGVPHRRGGHRQDGHRPQVLRGHGGLHGVQGTADRHDIRELQEHLRDRGAHPHNPPLRPGVRRQGVLPGGHGQDHGPAPVLRGQGHGDNPRRGGRPAQEGHNRHSLPADPSQGGVRAGVGGPDIPEPAGPSPGRGLQVDVRQVQRGQVRQVQPLGAPGDRRHPRGGGALPGRVDRGRHRRDSRRVRGVRGRQDGHRAAGPGGQHRRGGRLRGDGRGPRQGGQGHDIQLGLRFQAQVTGHQPDAGAAGGRQGDKGQPLGPRLGGRAHVRCGVRGVRRPGQEAHPVLDIPAGPGQDGHNPSDGHLGVHREEHVHRPPRHTVEGPGQEDGVDPGGDR